MVKLQTSIVNGVEIGHHPLDSMEDLKRSAKEFIEWLRYWRERPMAPDSDWYGLWKAYRDVELPTDD